LKRAAVYWAPSRSDPLWAAGCAWLGRDAESGAPCPQPPLPGIAELTAEARRYGFHATLRPPVRLATHWDEFREAVRDVARATKPFALPPLEIAEIGGFLALREAAPCPALQDLADRCVAATNPHCLPPSAEEYTRRRAAGLSSPQEATLQRWGYPYVMGEWFFHLTLSRRLSAGERQTVRMCAAAHFESVLDGPRSIDDIAIFTQGDGDFRIAERFLLG